MNENFIVIECEEKGVFVIIWDSSNYFKEANGQPSENIVHNNIKYTKEIQFGNSSLLPLVARGR